MPTGTRQNSGCLSHNVPCACKYAPESQQLNVQADVQVGLQLLGLSLVGPSCARGHQNPSSLM